MWSDFKKEHGFTTAKMTLNQIVAAEAEAGKKLHGQAGLAHALHCVCSQDANHLAG